MDDQATLSLLNVFDVDSDDGLRRLIAFVDPVRAGAEGISTRTIVGEIDARGDGNFDTTKFVPNTEFLAAIVDFMNSEPSRSNEVVEQAKTIPSHWLYVIDPRNASPEDTDPPASDVIGCYAVDDAGQIVPNSFQYNSEHRLFCPEVGPSGLLDDRRFFEWLNPSTRDSAPG